MSPKNTGRGSRYAIRGSESFKEAKKNGTAFRGYLKTPWWRKLLDWLKNGIR